jgi:plastocyanin
VHRSGFLRPPILSAAALIALALPACGGDGGAEGRPRTAQVVQKTFKFIPARIVVAPGSTVTWTNRDTVDHTVTAGSPGHPSGDFDRPLGKSATAVLTLDQAGTFPYFCSIHTSMKGQVVVR